MASGLTVTGGAVSMNNVKFSASTVEDTSNIQFGFSGSTQLEIDS